MFGQDRKIMWLIGIGGPVVVACVLMALLSGRWAPLAVLGLLVSGMCVWIWKRRKY